MNSKTVLLVGCGDIGTRAGLELLARGYHVAALRRNVSKLPVEFEAYSADYSEAGSLEFIAALQPDVVVTTFNPFERTEAGYRRGFLTGMANLLASLKACPSAQVIMASSTRVYAERDGGWVDEYSKLTKDDPWAKAIIEAENLLLNSAYAGSVVRFAGIYGIAGGRLLTRISRGEIAPREPLRYTNRIHREDCSGFLVHLIDKATQGVPLANVYLGVDDVPAPRYEVESWLAEQLGLDVAGLPHSDEPIRHNTGHRRCRNKALKESGYALRYPDYKAGYSALLA